MAMADGLSAAPGGCLAPEAKDGMIEQTISLVREYVDVAQQIGVQSRSLREDSACLIGDVRRLEEKLEALRAAMNAGIDECNGAKVRALMEAYKFTAGAMTSLTRGAHDPTYRDDRVRFVYPFEDRALWDSNGSSHVDTASDVSQCPYTTDYSPRSIGYIPDVQEPGMNLKSFGCDASVLGSLDDPADQIEVAPMKQFLIVTHAYSAAVAAFVNQITANIDASAESARTGESVPIVPADPLPPPLEHAVQSGCLRPGIPPLPAGAADASSVPGVDVLLNDYPDYFSRDNAHAVDAADGTRIVVYTLPEEILPVGMLLRPAYDLFNMHANALMAMRAYTERKTNQGSLRPVETQEGPADLLAFMFREKERSNTLRRIAENIERESGLADALGRDSLEQIHDAYQPLDDAMQSLVKAVDDDVPDYVSGLAYFLARQCADGHCQATLDSIQKRLHNPFCTPYLDGTYTDERMHVKCLCLLKSDDEPNGLDLANGDDEQFYNDYCLGKFTPEDEARYANMEAEPVWACQE